MLKALTLSLLCSFFSLTVVDHIGAQSSSYKVVTLVTGGAVTGTVSWSGPIPRTVTFPVKKDPQICDPDSRKTVDLERLIVGPEGGVANTVVYLRNISSGKAMDLPEPRRLLDQKRCRYEPHILLVPENTELKMNSSDATLHTIHMDGAATYNVTFPVSNQVISRTMQTPGLVSLRCNAGHVWMNAELIVVPHPYYAVTGQDGKFELTNVPPGDYQIVAWHEGWRVLRQKIAFDVLTARKVGRPVFSDPKTWENNVTVSANGTTVANFMISEK